MSVVMLFIARKEQEHVSLHGNDVAALEALERYVEDHWADARLSSEVFHCDPATRIGAWFKATQSLYVIAEASLEGLETSGVGKKPAPPKLRPPA